MGKMIIEFGYTVEKLYVQTGLPEETFFKEQKIHDAINILRVHSYIPESMVQRCYDKLLKSVQAAIDKFEEENA